MSRLGPRERSAFLTLKAACYSGLDSAALLSRIGERLGMQMGADATCMMQLDPETALPVHVVSDGWFDDDHRPLIEHALLASPAADPGSLLAQGRRTVAVDEIVPADRPYYRDPYFEYHLLLHSYRHELQTVCSAGRQGRAFLTVTRREAAGSFEAVHHRFLDAVAPHVAAGVHAATIREALTARPDRDAGLIVLDSHGKVDLANAVGERWLSSPDRPGRSGRLWILHVLAGLLSRQFDGDGALRVPAVDVSDPITGALYHLRAERSVGADGNPRTIILLEPIRRPERVETLMRMGLTRREAEVTLGLLQGSAADALAEELGISPHTVVQHVRGVFAKLEVSSRRELMLRLYGGF